MAGGPRPPRKGTYQHYKSAFYEVLGIGEDPATGNKWVVYESIGITEDLLAGKPGESESVRRTATRCPGS